VLPSTVVVEIQQHLDAFTAAGADSLVFTSPNGYLLRHSNFRRATWHPALVATGLAGVHFHDLRHAGNHLVAEAGANLRELMERMGHASSRAALIYLHSTQERQRALADAIDERARRDLGADSCGTYVARDAQAGATDDQFASSRGPPELEI
jgi:integrase